MSARIEYGFRCKSCPYARHFGARKLKSEIEAGKHARKYDWHEVELIEIHVTHTFTARDNMKSLFENNESPPF